MIDDVARRQARKSASEHALLEKRVQVLEKQIRTLTAQYSVV